MNEAPVLNQEDDAVLPTATATGCSGCGVATDKLQACAACRKAVYCSRDCQKQHWKNTHKIECRKNQKDDYVELLLRTVMQEEKEKPPAANIVLCPECEIRPLSDDTDFPGMCFSCGAFTCCGPCSSSPKMGGRNCRQTRFSFACQACEAKTQILQAAAIAARVPVSVPLPGKLLNRLLTQHSAGGGGQHQRHTNYARIILAQFMLNDQEECTGVAQNVKAAKKEYLALANDENYAPAQLVLASMYDPINHRNRSTWDGPTNFHHLVTTWKPYVYLFEPDTKLAIKYYDSAVRNKCALALEFVGTYYKNGNELYPQDTDIAMILLRKAAEMGQAKAMNNLANIHLHDKRFNPHGTGMAHVALFRQAADLGHHQSYCVLAQIYRYQQHMPDLIEQGRKYVQLLIDEWDIPSNGYDNYDRVLDELCEFYGLTRYEE